jgi:hypothetical protein
MKLDIIEKVKTDELSSVKFPKSRFTAVMDSTKQRESQAPQEAAIIDPREATIDPNDLFAGFQPFEIGAGGAISNLYRSITPNDTPESSRDGFSEPTSDISDGVPLDINLDVLHDCDWDPFGSSEIDGLIDMNSLDVYSADDFPMSDSNQRGFNFFSWDDMMNTSASVEAFSFDTSLFSMENEDKLPAAKPYATHKLPAVHPLSCHRQLAVKPPPTQDSTARQDHTSSAGFELSPGSHLLAASSENKSPTSNELQVYQVASSNIGHSSENPLEGNSPSCDQLQISSTILREDSQTLATLPTQSSRRPSPPTLGDKSTIKPIPSVHDESSSSRSNTLSSFTDDNSDWGEDEANGSVQDLYFPGFSAFSQKEVLSQEQVKDSLTRPVFSPMKQELIDRIMKEFWVIFNQESEAIQYVLRVKL